MLKFEFKGGDVNLGNSAYAVTKDGGGAITLGKLLKAIPVDQTERNKYSSEYADVYVSLGPLTANHKWHIQYSFIGDRPRFVTSQVRQVPTNIMDYECTRIEAIGSYGHLAYYVNIKEKE